MRQLCRTPQWWSQQIAERHRSWVAIGATKAVNNLAERVRRVAFAFRNLDNHRIRGCSVNGHEMLPVGGR